MSGIRVGFLLYCCLFWGSFFSLGTAGYYSPQSNPFRACQDERTLNQTRIRNGQMPFHIYHLANRSMCAGRVPHPYAGTEFQAVGWVPCSSAEALRVRLVNRSPEYAAGQYVGCFRDFDSAFSENRLDVAIPDLLSSSLMENGNQHLQCHQLAASRGYTVYGIRYKNRCYGGKDFGHALRYGSVGTCPTSSVNPYACCFSCASGSATGCMTGSHRSNAVYAVNKVKSPYPLPLPNQIFGTLEGSQMLGASAPFSGIMVNSLPYMSNSDIWSRMEVEGTGEIIVAAAYRSTENSGYLDYIQVGVGANRPWICKGFGKADVWYDICFHDKTKQYNMIQTASIGLASTFVLNIVSLAQMAKAVYSRPGIQFDSRVSTAIAKGDQIWTCYGQSPTWQGSKLVANTVYEGVRGRSNLAGVVMLSHEVYFSQLVTLTPDNRLVFYVGPDPARSKSFKDPVRYKDIDGARPPKEGGQHYIDGIYNYMSTPWFAMSRSISYKNIATPSFFQVAFRGAGVMVPDTLDPSVTKLSTIPSTATMRARSNSTFSVFVGDYACGCEYKLTTRLDGVCLGGNFCPTGRYARNVSTCGPNADCVPIIGSSGVGYNCICNLGFAYDSINARKVRNQFDVDMVTNKEINSCKTVEYSLLASNKGAQIYFKLASYLNVTLSIGLTNGQSNPSFFGAPLALLDSGVIRGNTTRFYQLDNLNGLELYVNAKHVLDNSTIIGTKFVLPCGCANSMYDYALLPPRRDDGRPIGQMIRQRDGKMYAEWTDDSICATQFSLHRIVINDEFLATYNSRVKPNDDSVARSDLIQELVDPNNQAEGVTVTSVITDFVLETSRCGTRYSPRQFYDDVAGSELKVGTPLFYCMLASDSKLSYSSGYSCVTDIIIQWEASFSLRVTAGRTTLPSVGVTVEWEARIPNEDSSEDGVVFANGVGLTDRDGSLQLRVMGNPSDFPELTTLTRIPVALWLSKESQIGVNETIQHTFMCDQGLRECNEADPQIIELALFSFGTTAVTIQDATVIPFRGKILLDETIFKNACPVAGVQVCLRAPPADDNSYSFGCTFTNAQGAYELAAPIGSTVVPVATFQNHVFERDEPVADQMIFRIRTQAVNNVDFRDVTTETLFVDIVGGQCNVPIARSVTITLTKNADLSCAGWKEHHLMNKLSPTRFSVVVPASYYEVSISSNSENSPNLPSYGGVEGLQQAESEGISDYLSHVPAFSLNLTNLEGRNPSFSRDSSLATDEYVKSRVVRFQYDVSPSMSLILTQNDLVVGTQTSCSKSDLGQVYVVHADYNQPVHFAINMTQTFATNEKCSNLAGVLRIKAETWDQSSSKFDEYPLTSVIDPETNLTSHSSVSFLTFLQPNILPPFTRFMQVGFQYSPFALMDEFLVTFIVVGHYMAENPATNAVPIVFDPIAIVRDPPGDSSYATYSNVESAVTYTSSEYDLFTGMVSDSALTVGLNTETEVCLGMGVIICNKGVETKTTYGLSATAREMGTQRISRTRSSFTRHVTWSFQTPGANSVAYHAGMLPGPMSDMFLVPVENIFFIRTYNISQEDECTASRSDPFYTFTLPQNNSGGIGWYSRYDIVNRVVPTLKSMMWDATTAQEFITLFGALEKWNAMLLETPDTVSIEDYFLFETLKGVMLGSQPIDVQKTTLDATREWSDVDLADLDLSDSFQERRVLTDGETTAVDALRRRLQADCLARMATYLSPVSTKNKANTIKRLVDGIRGVGKESKERLLGYIDTVSEYLATATEQIEKIDSRIVQIAERMVNTLNSIIKSSTSQASRFILNKGFRTLTENAFRESLHSLVRAVRSFQVSGTKADMDEAILLLGKRLDLLSYVLDISDKFDLLSSDIDQLHVQLDPDSDEFPLTSFRMALKQAIDTMDILISSKTLAPRKLAILKELTAQIAAQTSVLVATNRLSEVTAFDSSLAMILNNLRAMLQQPENVLHCDALESAVHARFPSSRRLGQNDDVFPFNRNLANACTFPDSWKAIVKRISEKIRISRAKIPTKPKLVKNLMNVAAKRLAGLVPFVGAALDVGFTIASAVDEDNKYKKKEMEPMPAWDPNKAPLLKGPIGPLQSKPSLWSSQEEWTDKQRNAAMSNSISFSGGGSEVKVEVSDEFTGEKGITVNEQVQGSLALRLDTELNVAGGSLDDKSKFGFEFSGMTNFVNASVTTKITSASFVLADSTPGDYFVVSVSRDLRFGTFAFDIEAGASKCPVEPETDAREVPVISSRPGDSSAPFAHPNSPAYFHLTVQNKADDPYFLTSFEFAADLKSLNDSVRVLANGMPLNHPIVFENLASMTSYPILLEVHRGAELYDLSFNVTLRSQCQLLVDSHNIEVKFAKPCPGIELAGSLSSGDPYYVLADQDPQLLYLDARRPIDSPLATTAWKDLDHVSSVRYQYRTNKGSAWTALGFDITESNGVSVPWDISALPKESTVYVRAEVVCHVQGFAPSQYPELFSSVSSTAVVHVDRIRPMLYEATPSRPVSVDVTKIDLAFSEPIHCENPFPFQVRVSFSGVNAPPPLFLPSDSPSLIGRCVDNVISIGLLYGFDVDKLRRVDVAGRQMTITLEQVRDEKGNLAISNVLNAPYGFIQHVVHYLPVHPEHTWFKISKLLVSGLPISSDVNLSRLVLDALIDASMAINSTRIYFTDIDTVESLPGTLTVDFLVSPAAEGDEDVVKFFDRLTDKTNGLSQFRFAPGGGIDIFFNDEGQQGVCGVALPVQQHDSLNSSTDTVTIKIKMEAMNQKIEALDDKLKTSMDELKTLMVSLANSSGAGSSSASHSDFSADSSHLSIVAIVCWSVLVTLVIVGAAIWAARKMQERKANSVKNQLARRTGDFSVVGSSNSSNLHVSAYNEQYSPHPVFGDSDNA